MIVGCGLGDDAQHLASLGFNVTAFDISPTAINWARQRFLQSPVNYSAINLFAMPKTWSRAFDFVFEAYTLQVLPIELRKRAVDCIADLVAPNGQLLIVARAKDANAPQGTMPWPLLREEVEDFTRTGLSLISFEDYIDNDDSPVRRFRALFHRK
jgi:2-polyprenyl-3-methyl-5-hydroxy-6-metoxy-1,4-benzoquinol methylase